MKILLVSPRGTDCPLLTGSLCKALEGMGHAEIEVVRAAYGNLPKSTEEIDMILVDAIEHVSLSRVIRTVVAWTPRPLVYVYYIGTKRYVEDTVVGELGADGCLTVHPKSAGNEALHVDYFRELLPQQAMAEAA